MAKLFLLRHIKSQWNEENRFTGWIDVPLDEKEVSGAKKIAKKILKNKIDVIYSSMLFRNEDTIARMFEFGNKKYPVFIHLDNGKMKKRGGYKDISRYDVPVFVTAKLNERYYGKLQGENKKTAMKKFGKEKVRLWRRSYDIAPPEGESLRDVEKRTAPFYKKYVEKDLKSGKNVLIVASHNALRAIVKYIEKIPKEEIINLEIPYGSAIKYEFNKKIEIKGKKML